MSIAQNHNEWLSLVDISGPFLSVKVLKETFPQGIERVDSGARSDLRAAHESWADNQQGVSPSPVYHAAWVDYVLSDFLDYDNETLLKVDPDTCPAAWETTLIGRQITLRPDFVLKDEDETTPFMLLRMLDSRQGLEKRSTEAYSDEGDMTPTTQMLELLRGTGIGMGLLTNGSAWMLVYAVQGEAASYATWSSELWFEEPVTLDAFYTLLHLRRFFAPDDEQFPALMAASVSNQHDVTTTLGKQVRHAVEILVQSIAKEDANANGTLLAHLDDQQIYEAALTVMMRLVFLLSAEEQGLLLLGDPIYDQNYAVSTLRGQLRDAADQVGEEVIERRTDAWARLLATFRAVYTGIWHPDLRLPAYGGSLFDPDRFPFLEGRRPDQPFNDPTLTPLQLDNRTVLHLLEALQLLELKAGGITTVRALSFRALDVEQIGHVYEGLLDHKAVRATTVVIGLTGIGGREPEIALATLEAMESKGAKAFNKFMKDATGRTAARIKKLRAEPLSDLRRGRMLSACGGDEALLARVERWAGLMRDDSRKVPIVILPDEVYVTAGATRRQTGSHYTPRSLTEPIVQHTLEPLVYVGPAEGVAREDWTLKSAGEILALNVCDMAMGSGAFLVQACRWLAQRLMEAWRLEGGELGSGPTDTRPFVGPYATQNLDELYALAKRLIAERCLYGVDKNPLAVEMAKLSLWLVTLSKNKPFTFVDHALRHGDSLIGIDEEAFHHWSRTDATPRGTLLDEENRRILAEVKGLRKELRLMQVLDVQDAKVKAAKLADADAKMARLMTGANFLVGLELLDWKKAYKPYKKDAVKLEALLAFQAGNEFSVVAKAAIRAAHAHDAFHWQFEFPEVFEQGGFSAFVGNPPFIGGKRIRESLGDAFRQILYALYPNSAGGADISAFFFLRAFRYLRSSGTLGLIATNTIAQGDTRKTGLDNLLENGGKIYRSRDNVSWPGHAAITVTIVNLVRGNYLNQAILNNQPVKYISSLLTTHKAIGEPHALIQNRDKSFVGSFVNGIGFVISIEDAQKLMRSNSQYSEVLYPYMTGRDLNMRQDQSASRWIINFFDWDIEIAKQYAEPFDIIRKYVYPARAKVRRKAHREYWWHYGDKRPKLYSIIKEMDRVLIISEVSKYVSFAFKNTGIVFSHMLIVIALDTWSDFAVLQSDYHRTWVWAYCSTMRNAGIRYSPSEGFTTFPFPDRKANLEVLGEAYHSLRQSLANIYECGITQINNRFHDTVEQASDIVRLRALHVQMDEAVAAAYGWDDLALDHGFHETAQGIRFTISETARREVLQRLLKLNHQRYAEEVAAGLHDKKKKKSKKQRASSKKKAAPAQKSLF
ncbi:MAG: Eco57I restriction-modification methylase domain-containing protein [Candidatus Promineifilaceae bacterium]